MFQRNFIRIAVLGIAITMILSYSANVFAQVKKEPSKEEILLALGKVQETVSKFEKDYQLLAEQEKSGSQSNIVFLLTPNSFANKFMTSSLEGDLQAAGGNYHFIVYYDEVEKQALAVTLRLVSGSWPKPTQGNTITVQRTAGEFFDGVNSCLDSGISSRNLGVAVMCIIRLISDTVTECSGSGTCRDCWFLPQCR